jgi:hypothetical protein
LYDNGQGNLFWAKSVITTSNNIFVISSPYVLVSQVIVLTMGKGVTSLFSKTLKLHENKQAQMSLYFSEIQT